jgi:phosphatidylserine/phosphatidylglycerophosphate/cardiolipin synthase-like enzyme
VTAQRRACGAQPARRRRPRALFRRAAHATLARAGLHCLVAAAALRGGTEMLPAMFAAIAAAHDHVDLEYYVFEDVHVAGEGPGDLLARRLADSVAVNVIMDGNGSLGAAPAFLDGLRRAGAAILVSHPVTPEQVAALRNPNDRDHRKILVVDARIEGPATEASR